MLLCKVSGQSRKGLHLAPLSESLASSLIGEVPYARKS